MAGYCRRSAVCDGGGGINKALYKVPPIGTRGGGIDPRPEKGSRTQSTTTHKNGNDGIGYITRRLHTSSIIDSEDGITLHLYK